jgi:hypothetical protein
VPGTQIVERRVALLDGAFAQAPYPEALLHPDDSAACAFFWGSCPDPAAAAMAFRLIAASHSDMLGWVWMFDMDLGELVAQLGRALSWAFLRVLVANLSDGTFAIARITDHAYREFMSR